MRITIITQNSIFGCWRDSYTKQAQSFFSGLKDDTPSFEIDILRDQTIDFAHPCHGLLDGQQITLGIWSR